MGRGSSRKIDGAIAVVSPSVYSQFRAVIDGIDEKPVIFSRASATGEPSQEDVIDLAHILGNRIKKNPAGPVAAIGGGSVIDAVKLALAFVSSPELNFENIYAGGFIPPLAAKLIAVETTAGTGTGVTAFAVVLKKDGTKRGFGSFFFIPAAAYYDADFIDALPKDVFAPPAMDALTHAVESYVSTVENVPAGAMALEACRLIEKNAVAGYKGDGAARELVHCANMLAGLAFSNARLGMCHALAHLIGGRFGIPHGRINAILLPAVVKFNSKSTDKYDDIAGALGIAKGTLGKYLEELNNRLGIETSLGHIGDKFKKMIPEIAGECENARLMAYNPRKASAGEIEELLYSLV